VGLHNPEAHIFVPDGVPEEQALGRTTHLGVGCHPDDLEIMAYPGILECFGRAEKWFGGITVTNGGGCPRADIYAAYSDAQMIVTRRREQKKAAAIGEYGFVALLDYPSSAVKDPGNADVVAELKQLIAAAGPAVVYTHNLADKHTTHVAVALRTIRALRELPPDVRPAAVYGCEIWRDLDWLLDEDKTVLDVSAHENLGAALLGVHDSQIAGCKRYDLATPARRRAQATFHEGYEVDTTTGLVFAMDLTPLIQDPGLHISTYVAGYVDRLRAAVVNLIEELA